MKKQVKLAVIIKAKKSLCKKHNLKWKELHYIGFTDATRLNPGYFQLCFTVQKKTHSELCYKTTLAYNFYPKKIKNKNKKRSKSTWKTKLTGLLTLTGFLILYIASGSIENDTLNITDSFLLVSLGFTFLFGFGALYLNLKNQN